MKKSKKSNIVIVLVVVLLALAVGYAAFSTNLTITGTAKTKTGNWDVEFTAASITPTTVSGNFGVNDEKSSTSFTPTNVTVNAVLQAPGDGANVTATITNAGKLNAVLKDFKVDGEGFAEEGTNVYKNGDIRVKVPVTTNGNIAAGASRNFVFSVEWDKNASDITTSQTANFTITFTYEQDGQVFNGVQSFDVVNNVVTTNN